MDAGKRETGMAEEAGGAAAKMHWVRVLIGGFLAEAALILLVIPVAIKWGQHPLLFLAPAGSLVFCFLFGFWVGRGVKSRFVLPGLLVGAVAVAIYLASFGTPTILCWAFSSGLMLCGSSKSSRNGWQSSAWNYTRIRPG